MEMDELQRLVKNDQERRRAQINTKILALSDRMAALERHIGLKTVICAGYCEQPTANPSGMCLACQARERLEDRESRRRHGR